MNAQATPAFFELKNIKVLGYTTDFQKCECCGKEGLKGTVSILDLRYDVVLHFGTTCAYNANKYDSLDAANEAKRLVNESLKEFGKKVKLEEIKRVQNAITLSISEYRQTDEYKTYTQQMTDREFLLENCTDETHSTIIHESIKLGGIARAKALEIALKNGVPQNMTYKVR